MRDRGLTSSYGVAFNAGRLDAAIPATAALESFESAPSDIMVNQALQLARLWRQLAEMRTWRPLADTETVRETLRSLGCRLLPDTEIEEWMAFVDAEQGPMLIRAGRATRDWMNRPGVTDRDLGGIFLAACLLSGGKSRRPVALPFWSAAEARHQRRELQVGVRWLAAFLDCIAAAAKAGLDELERLRRTEEISRSLGLTARSRLPDAANAVLRASIVTACDLAATLAVSPQAALGLLRQLTQAGLVREATNQKSWRAFVLNI